MIPCHLDIISRLEIILKNVTISIYGHENLTIIHRSGGEY